MQEEKLIIDNLALAGFTAKRYIRRGIEYDDLVSLCYMGLIKAARTYDQGKAAFSSYASKCMENEILQEIRKNKRHMGHVTTSLDAGLADDATLADIIPDPRDAYQDLDESMSKVDLAGLCRSTLTGDDMDVIRLLYFAGKTQYEVAAIIHKSQPQVCRIRKRALGKLRAAMRRQLRRAYATL